VLVILVEYKSAREKAKLSETTSDLESSEAGTPLIRRARKRARPESSSALEDVTPDHELDDSTVLESALTG